MREGPAESPERFGEQFDVKIGQIRDIQLAGLAPTQTLHRLDAFRRQGQYAPGINQEGPPLLRQGHLTPGTVQEEHANLLLQVVNLSGEGGLR